MTELQAQDEKMRTIEVRLPEELLQRLEQRAHEAGGRDRAEYIRGLIEKDVAADLALKVIFAPVHEHSRQMAYSEEELAEVYKEALLEVRQERRGAKDKDG